jgi:hypothetical protein
MCGSILDALLNPNTLQSLVGKSMYEYHKHVHPVIIFLLVNIVTTETYIMLLINS